MGKKYLYLIASLGAVCGWAASLQVYQDGTVYTYSPANDFVGITQGIEATCQGNPLALVQKMECSGNERLCRTYNALNDEHIKLDEITANAQMLTEILSMHKINTLDAASTLRAAREISKEKAALGLQEKTSQEHVKLLEDALGKQTPADLPLYYLERCESPVKLTFGYGMIGFDGYYEADISGEGEVKVTQYLSVTNRSGVDIKADEATFYYRQSRQYVNPVHFGPWVVKKYEPPVIASYAPKSVAKARAAEELMMMEASVAAPAPVVSQAYYNDAREYGISGLVLPSSGVAVNVPVVSWTAPVQCGLQLYAYANTDVYEACTFTPDKQIEGYGWKVKKGEEVLNANASGEYIGQTYSLYTKIDPDIQVIRKPIVQKEGDTGFFGGTVRKKDGYTVEILNKSDKIKKISITERIPVSTNEKIEVKLLSVDTEYRMEKDGKIAMDVTLASKESKKITVMFELSYDKEMKVVY